MEDWISILFVAIFFILPIVVGKKKKSAQPVRRTIQDFPDDNPPFIDKFEEFEEFEESGEGERAVPLSRMRFQESVPIEVEEDEVEKIGADKEKIDKRKLIIYSEILKPRFKEF